MNHFQIRSSESRRHKIAKGIFSVRKRKYDLGQEKRFVNHSHASILTDEQERHNRKRLILLKAITDPKVPSFKMS